jgi:hypothetical protein
MDRNGQMVELQQENGCGDDVPRDWYPFDPYNLPRSKGFVIDTFMEYAAPDEDEEMVTDGDDTDISNEMDEDDM